MGRRILVTVLGAAAIATAASACGSSSGSNSGAAPLNPKVASAYVIAQARALCLVQSKAYPTEAALHAAYAQAEHSAKMSAQQLAQARTDATHNPAMRRRISEQVAATCEANHRVRGE
jgi:hypothetical protein